MKALFTLSMVVDLAPDEIPKYAVDLERGGLAGMYAGIIDALDGRELDDDTLELMKEKFQIFGVSYSVLHELELPT